MENKDYVSLETAKLLRKKGFNKVCNKSYLHHCRVKNEIYKKYPGLSDDGYRDLVDVEGLSEDEVYGYYDEIVDFTGCNKPSWSEYNVQFIAAAPTLYEAQNWLMEEYNLYISISPYLTYNESAKLIVDIYRKIDNKWKWVTEANNVYSSYQQALDAGLRETLKHI